MSINYRTRIADAMLARKLAGMGAVLVEGAKWCGKTTTCERFAKSTLYMADPQKRGDYLRYASVDVSPLLEGATPRLIDEWQDAPQFWDAVRYRVDHSAEEGLFILTGSSVVPKNKEDAIVHSGTGRIARLKMRPMSLWESGESSGKVSIGTLLKGEGLESVASRPLEIKDVAYLICRGGWPKAVDQTGDIALDRAFDYLEAVVNADVSRTDGVARDPDRVRQLLRSYARLQGTQANLSTIRRDMLANDVRSLDEDTIRSYHAALKRIFVVEDLKAWCPSLRAKESVRTTDTRYFTDPSIAAAAMGVTPGGLMQDIRTLGLFFEAMAVRDLRIYVESLMGHVEHYHDGTGLECDAVLQTRTGEYALVEIKLGGALVDEGAATLRMFDGLIRKKKYRPPVFSMVLTATGDMAYRREDGILVCPLSALRP